MPVKKILILGGTQFVGRNLVERLRHIEGFDVVLFNRQRTSAGLFQELRQIKGDRETNDIEQFTSEDWDVVVDLSCYFPDSLASIVNALEGRVGKYVLISTCSVYDNSRVQIEERDEFAPILPCDLKQSIDRTPNTYGHRKAECERILQNSGLDYVILRPALVYGTYDHTDRFYYWLNQVKTNASLLVPEGGNRVFSLTYVADLVETIIQSWSSPEIRGAYNTISHPRGSIKRIIESAQVILGKENVLLSAESGFLHENGISQWEEMPLWLNSDYFTYSNHRLLEDFELIISPFEQSVEHSIAYFDRLGWPDPVYGISEEKRQELINKLD